MKTKLAYICGFSIIFFAWSYYYTTQEEEKYQHTAIPFMLDAVADISTWQSSVLFDYLAEEAKRNITEQQLDTFVEQYRALGRFEKMDTPEFSKLSSVLSIFSSDTKKISYSGNAFFANGSATITVTLVERGGIFKFYNFNLGSITLFGN